MKKIVLALFIVSSTMCVAQTTIKDTTDDYDKIFYTVEKVAQFEGGMQGWKKFLEINLKAELGSKHIKIPKGQKSARQTVIMSFTIDTLGNVTNIIVENLADVHKELAEESVRVLKKSPRWLPAEQDGRKVIFRHKQSITFVANKE